MQSIEIEPLSAPAAPPSRPLPVALVALDPGRSARLHAADLPDPEVALLRALGLTDRALLRLAKAGDPWIIQVRSTRIGLSQAVAQRILVVPEPAARV